jgi:hypothetical protein
VRSYQTVFRVQIQEGHQNAVRRKIQFSNRFTNLSLDINHIDSHISFDITTVFHASNRRLLLTDIELRRIRRETWGMEPYAGDDYNLIISCSRRMFPQLFKNGILIHFYKF